MEDAFVYETYHIPALALYTLTVEQKRDDFYEGTLEGVPYGSVMGHSLEKLLINAQEKADSYTMDLIRRGEPTPEVVLPCSSPDENRFSTVIVCDVPMLQKKANPRTVRTTVTIPEWVSIEGKRRGINFSSALTKTLMEMFD